MCVCVCGWRGGGGGMWLEGGGVCGRAESHRSGYLTTTLPNFFFAIVYAEENFIKTEKSCL